MQASTMTRDRADAAQLMIVYPYKECVGFIEQLSSQIPVGSLLVNGERLDDNLRRTLDGLMRRCLPDAVIGRGIVTTYISRLFPNSSIIRIDPGPVDLMKPLKVARSFGDRVGILSFPDQGIEENLEAIQEIFEFRSANIYQFQTGQDIDDQVVHAKLDGMHSIVGGGLYCQRAAKSHCIPAVHVEISSASVRRAIEQAVSVIRSKERDRETFKDLAVLASRASDGVLLLREDKIAFCNSAAVGMLGVDDRPYLNESIRVANSALGVFVEHSDLGRGTLTLNDRDYCVERIRCGENHSSSIVILKEQARGQLRELLRRSPPARGSGHRARFRFDDIVGQSSAITDAIKNGMAFAQSDADILLVGESGTGKEMFAQSIHNHSPRRDRPFVAVNCGAIPETLIESELFGYVDGAFTGARKGGKVGLFELAHLGTICLDEISSLPFTLQGKLLRVLQERVLRRVGSEIETPIDVRVVSCTNRDLRAMTRSGEFRSDLFYRISTLPLLIPPLSQRGDDVARLADHFVKVYSARYRKSVQKLSVAQKQALINRHWFGNVRELENLIHRYVVLNSNNGEDRFPEDEPTYTTGDVGTPPADMLTVRRGNLSDMEKDIISAYLRETRWNRKEAARRLGISRTTLWRKLNET